MHNGNANAAISRHDTLASAETAPQAAVTPANSIRRPLVLLKGGALIRFPDASTGIFPVTRNRRGPVAGFIRMIEAGMVKVRMKRNARKEARTRRMADDEMSYLSHHILRDIGLSRGRRDAGLRGAPLHGPRL